MIGGAQVILLMNTNIVFVPREHTSSDVMGGKRGTLQCDIRV